MLGVVYASVPVPSVILVEPSGAANVGAALRVAANFGAPAVELVRPGPAPDDPEVAAWSCGGGVHLEVRRHDTFADAAGPYRLVAATVSGRGRGGLPVVTPQQLLEAVRTAGAGATALVFGNETSGLPRAVVDRADAAVRIPTNESFPVMNLAQAVAVLLGWLAISGAPSSVPSSVPTRPQPPRARHDEVAGLMAHAREALLGIGFLDPTNPDRILRQLRRLIGRAAATTDEVSILRGICRQVQWAARREPGRWNLDCAQSDD